MPEIDYGYWFLYGYIHGKCKTQEEFNRNMGKARIEYLAKLNKTTNNKEEKSNVRHYTNS